MKILKEQQELAEKFEKECYDAAGAVVKRTNFPDNFSVVINKWIFQKLAQQELEIRKLKHQAAMHRPIGGGWAR